MTDFTMGFIATVIGQIIHPYHQYTRHAGESRARSPRSPYLSIGLDNMLRRASYLNVPTDIARSIVCIVEAGSFTKAAEHLGLTQPAISSQVKRFQVLVGGAVFERSTGGVALTDRGKMLLPLLRRMLEANDQMLHIGGAAQDPRPLRFGMSTVFVERYLEHAARDFVKGINLLVDNSDDVNRALEDGYLDIAVVLSPGETVGIVHSRWSEPITWVRSRDFTLSAGCPVPLIGAAGFELSRVAIKALEHRGVAYRLAVSSTDPAARLKAVKAGLGVMLLPTSMVTDDLVQAREYYLPQVAPMQAGIISCAGLERDLLLRCLTSLSAFTSSESGATAVSLHGIRPRERT